MFFGGGGCCGGFNGVGAGFVNTFFRVLINLLNFRVAVQVVAAEEEIVGLLVAVAVNFITLNTLDGSVTYIPIHKIASIRRVFE
ncbi:MAG: hypothetical protein ACM3NT_11575 [Methylocystaceae bacterium]